MRVCEGRIVRAHGKVVQVLSPIEGYSAHWRCDDGRVYEEQVFTPADAREIRAKAQEINARLKGIDEYLEQEKRA